MRKHKIMLIWIQGSAVTKRAKWGIEWGYLCTQLLSCKDERLGVVAIRQRENSVGILNRPKKLRYVGTALETLRKSGDFQAECNPGRCGHSSMATISDSVSVVAPPRFEPTADSSGLEVVDGVREWIWLRRS